MEQKNVSFEDESPTQKTSTFARKNNVQPLVLKQMNDSDSKANLESPSKIRGTNNSIVSNKDS